MKERTEYGEGKITLWASQAPVVREILRREGVSYVKNIYVDRKYGESAWIFRTVYREFGRLMAQKVSRPPEAESPVWLYRDPGQLTVSPDSVVMKLAVPAEETVLFDARDWNRMLNLTVIGSGEEREAWEQELQRQGVKDSADLFRTSFYPLLRRKLTGNWRRILEPKGIPECWLQGAVWQLRESWIVEELTGPQP